MTEPARQAMRVPLVRGGLVRGADVVVGLVLAAILVGPAVVGGGLAGSGGAEVYGHAWVQWWAAEQWPAWPVGTTLADGTLPWPVIDPLPTWLVAGLAQVLGPTAAWNVWAAAGVVLAAMGGGAFARALGGSGIVGAVGVATMPIFLGSLTSGLTEDYALGLVALALAALLRGPVGSGPVGSGPVGSGPWTRDSRLLGGALLGLSAWCGLYLAWLGGLAAAAIGLWRLRDRPARWLLAGLLAVAIALPAAAPFRDRLGGVGHRSGVTAARPEPLWRLDPWRGADLASFGAPGKVEVGGAFVREHPVYLGYATVGLAALGGWHPAWLGVLACAAVAPGEHLSWAGQPLSASNPVISAFRWLPFAERFNHHARVMLLGQLVLVGLAARGAKRRGGWILGLLGRGAAPQRGCEAVSPKIEPVSDDLTAAGAPGAAVRGELAGGDPLGGEPDRALPAGLRRRRATAQRSVRGAGPPGPPGSAAPPDGVAAPDAHAGPTFALEGVFALALFAETALVSPARVPLPVAPTATPAIYEALSMFPADLPVVVVGAAGPGIHPQRVFFDQRAHGRRLLHNPNRPSDGRPRDGVVVVALGDAVARVTTQRGPPDVTAPDGAAWGPRGEPAR